MPNRSTAGGLTLPFQGVDLSMRQTFRVALLGACLVACGASETKMAPPVAEPKGACDRPTVPRQRWRSTHLGTLLSGERSAEHSADDVIVTAGSPATLRGRFTYTALHKDLEREAVTTFLAERTGCKTNELGTSFTNDDGKTEVVTPPMAVGQYPYFMIVPGDGSSTDGMVWAITPGTKAVLFDIDGTLTTGDSELFEDLLGGSANMFADANRVVQRWADAGYLIVYATGRPNFLRNHTRHWLQKHEFPPGALFTVDSLRQALPTASGVGIFKTNLISRLIATGLVFERAYGNAATDACAYMRSGIEPSRVYMTNNQVRNCDGKSTLPLASYTAHLATLVVPPLR